MGFWDTLTQAPIAPAGGGVLQLTTPYTVYEHYFSPYTEGGKLYNVHTFRDDIREARNHGVDISGKEAHAMRLLAKHDADWFNEDGSLKDGLSRRDAKRALKFRARAANFYSEIKKTAPKKKEENKEETSAQWAANNFIKRGYDTEAAQRFAQVSNYTDAANLWGGDVLATLKGGSYGAKAASAEKAFYDTLSAPEKRAYLKQRELWVRSGLISPSAGLSTANLGTVSEYDMKNYMRDNLQTWQTSFYGDNGYEDEYAETHLTPDQNEVDLLKSYGLTPKPASTSWTPHTIVRTDFPEVISNVKKDLSLNPKNKFKSENKDKDKLEVEKKSDLETETETGAGTSTEEYIDGMTKEEFMAMVKATFPNANTRVLLKDLTGQIFVIIDGTKYQYGKDNTDRKGFIQINKIGGKLMKNLKYFNEGGLIHTMLSGGSFWDYVPLVATVRSIGRAVENPTFENVAWALADGASDLTIGLGSLGKAAGKFVLKKAAAESAEQVAKGATKKAALEAILKNLNRFYNRTVGAGVAGRALVDSHKGVSGSSYSPVEQPDNIRVATNPSFVPIVVETDTIKFKTGGKILKSLKKH